MTFQQDQQELRIEEPTHDLLVAGLVGEEAVSEPFLYTVRMVSEKKSISASDLLQKPVCLFVRVGQKERPIHGRVRRFVQGRREGKFTSYEMEVVPWLWFLSLSGDCRFFENKSVIDITKTIFQEQKLTDFRNACTKTHQPRLFCAQYNETNLDFLRRLWEEEGIFFFFEHDERSHTLVLADDPGAVRRGAWTDTLQNIVQDGSYDVEEYAENIRVEHAVHTSKVVLTDWDFQKTSGPFSVTAATDGVGELHRYDGVDEKPTVNEFIARTRIEHEEAMRTVITGASSSRGLTAGSQLAIDDAPSLGASLTLQLLRVRLEMGVASYQGSEGAATAFKCEFTAIPSSVPYRPSRVTPKPRIVGAQTAIVHTEDGEEITVDKYGRVRVKFHWDRKHNPSCWVRVASGWAGASTGFVQWPRVGEEVVVEFLNGDPDRPVITGRLYNAAMMPPYELPTNKTQTGMRSRTSPDNGAAAVNELRFEDKKDAEEIFMHAQKDLHAVVENEETRLIKKGKQEITLEEGDRTLAIKKGHETITIDEGDQKLTLGKGSQTVVLHKDRTITLDTGNDELKISQGNMTIAISVGDLKIGAKAGQVSIEAMKGIELKVGANSIKVDPAGITIEGIKVSIAGQATTEVKSPMTTVKGDGMLTLKGAMTMIN